MNQLILPKTKIHPVLIDLLITDQPQRDSGTRPSVDSKCHHQIVYGKFNYKIPIQALLKEKYGTITMLTLMLLGEVWRVRHEPNILD